MAVKLFTDEELVAAWTKHSGVTNAVAAELGVSLRTVLNRRAQFEVNTGHSLVSNKMAKEGARSTFSNKALRAEVALDTGVILVGSDAHYWPEEESAAHRAFVYFCKQLKPDLVVLNGDVLDGARISRHGRIGWEPQPTLNRELETVIERLKEIEKAAKGAQLWRTHGNHDMRFDTYLSNRAGDVEGVMGMSLKDHLPLWTPMVSLMVNGHTHIKHRNRSGVHATWNNINEAFINVVTGHTHSLRVTPKTSLSPLNNGTVYGVDTGTLANPWGPQFHYVEDNPRNWRSGFAVLTFFEGNLMPPELVQVIDESRGYVYFRGDVYEV